MHEGSPEWRRSLRPEGCKWITLPSSGDSSDFLLISCSFQCVLREQAIAKVCASQELYEHSNNSTPHRVLQTPGRFAVLIIMLHSDPPKQKSSGPKSCSFEALKKHPQKGAACQGFVLSAGTSSVFVVSCYAEQGGHSAARAPANGNDFVIISGQNLNRYSKFHKIPPFRKDQIRCP